MKHKIFKVALVTFSLFLLFFGYATAQSCIGLTLVTTDVTCYGTNNFLSDGTAYFLNEGEVVVTTNEYTFSWSDQSQKGAAMAENLAGGSYSVTVTDGSCQEVFNFSIWAPRSFNVAVETYPVHICPPQNGAITIRVTGANNVEIEDFGIEWLNANVSGAKVSNLTSKKYWYRITVDGCSKLLSAFVGRIPAVVADVTYVDNVIDTPGELITLTASVVGGEPPYDYIWYDMASNQQISTGPSLQTKEPGCYGVEVIDRRGCSSSINEHWIACVYSNLPAEPAMSGEVGHIYPNPATNEISVPVANGKNVISIYNLQGKLLQQLIKTFPEKQDFRFELSLSQSGTYLLLNKTDDLGTQIFEKIVVQQ